GPSDAAPPPATEVVAQRAETRRVQEARPGASIRDFQLAADARRVRITIPEFEDTPGEVVASVDSVLAEAEANLSAYAAQDAERTTFRSAIARLDDIVYPVVNTTSRLYLIKESSTDPAVRAAATEQVTRLQEWFVGLQYREDVYRVVKAF